MELLIKDARIVDCSQNFMGDVYIKDGIIHTVGLNIEVHCPVINGDGLVLMPAFTDLHCHFRDPGYTYKEDIFTGCRAAVRGGYTTVNLMANTNPVCSDMETVYKVLEKAKEIDLVDIYQTVSMTKGFDGKDISHIESLTDEVKCISEDGRGVASAKIMLQVLEKAKEKGLIVMCHEEDADLVKTSTRLAENIMTMRDIELAKAVRASIHIAHVSTAEAVNCIIDAKKQGYGVTCEVTPHHIALDDKVKYSVNPPLRQENDKKALIEAIKNKWIDVIATDHAPHTAEDKENGAPGISGIETAFSVCYTKLVKEGHITLNVLSELMSRNPAKILSINKGEIKPGFYGDLVLVDTNKKLIVQSERFNSKGKNTPFEGMEFYGEVVTTIKQGKIVYDTKRGESR